MIGRLFTAQEEEHNQHLVILSYATWKGRFHADPKILGHKILLDRQPYIIIGVMPRNFDFLTTARDTSLPQRILGSPQPEATKI